MSLLVAFSPNDRLEVSTETIERTIEWLVPESTAVVRREANLLLISRDRADIDTLEEPLAALAGEGFFGDRRLTAADVATLHPEEFDETGGEFVGVARLADRLRVVTDRLTLRQLFAYRSSELFVAGTSIAAVLEVLTATGHGDLTLDTDAIAGFLEFGYFLGDRTHVFEIRLLPAATVLDVTVGTAGGTDGEPNDESTLQYASSVYWEYAYTAPFEDRETAIDVLTGAFTRAIERRASGRVGVHLSGGLDSRLNLAAAPEDADLTAYTFGVPGGDEGLLARAAAKLAGRPFRFFPLRRYHPADATLGVRLTDGLVSIGNFHHLSTMTATAAECDRLVLGVIGSTLSGGKVSGGPQDTESAYRSFARASPAVLDRLFDDGPFAREHSKRQFDDSWTALDDAVAASGDGLGLSDAEAEVIRMDLWNARHRQSRFNYQGGTRSISEFLPVANPMGDRDLLTAILRLSPALRSEGDLRVDVLERLAPALAWLPDANDWAPPRVPQLGRLTHKAKMALSHRALRRRLPVVREEVPHGYPDYGAWLRTDPAFRTFVERALRSFAGRGYGDSAALEQLLTDHLAGRGRYVDELLFVVTLELWFQEIAEAIPGLQLEGLLATAQTAGRHTSDRVPGARVRGDSTDQANSDDDPSRMRGVTQ